MEPRQDASESRELDAKSTLSSKVHERREHLTLVGALELAAAERAPFVTFWSGTKETVVDAAWVLEEARRWALTLRVKRVTKGSIVPLVMTTSADFVAAFLGTMLLGALPAPIAAPMTFGNADRYLENLSHILDVSRASCIVTTPRLRDAIQASPSLQSKLTNVLTEVHADRARGLFHLPPIDAGDDALVQFSSGTTSRPKGIVLTHRALVANAAAIQTALGLNGSQTGASWLPLFHDMGLIGVLVTAVCHPYRLYVMSPESFVMRPDSWLRCISEKRATVSAAPNFAYELCMRRDTNPEQHDLSSWQVALSGAEPVRPATCSRFADRYRSAEFDARSFLPSYGLAEATLMVTAEARGVGVQALSIEPCSLGNGAHVTPSATPTEQQCVSVGAPVAGTTVSVRDARGRDVPECTVGEIQVKGPSVLRAYLTQDGERRDAVSNGWLATGDLGFVHAGRLFVVGRAKEVIIKGGRNIHPADVEAVAESMDGVLCAAAFGVPNDATGTEDLVLACETRSPPGTSRDALAQELIGALLGRCGIKADSVVFTTPGGIPRTTSGKIKRHECARTLTEKVRT